MAFTKTLAQIQADEGIGGLENYTGYTHRSAWSGEHKSKEQCRKEALITLEKSDIPRTPYTEGSMKFVSDLKEEMNKNIMDDMEEAMGNYIANKMDEEMLKECGVKYDGTGTLPSYDWQNTVTKKYVDENSSIKDYSNDHTHDWQPEAAAIKESDIPPKPLDNEKLKECGVKYDGTGTLPSYNEEGRVVNFDFSSVSVILKPKEEIDFDRAMSVIGEK